MNVTATVNLATDTQELTKQYKTPRLRNKLAANIINKTSQQNNNIIYIV